MGRNSRCKAKKNPRSVASKSDLRKAAQRVEREHDRKVAAMKENLVEKVARITYPVAEQNAFCKLMYCTLITYRDKDGYGKQRLRDRADAILNQYECVLENRVTLEEMSDVIFEITGHRFEIQEDELARMLVEAAEADNVESNKQRESESKRKLPSDGGSKPNRDKDGRHSSVSR